MNYGMLNDYKTGRAIRPATADEWQASVESEKSMVGGGTGAFELNGQAVYVDGGPDMKTNEEIIVRERIVRKLTGVKDVIWDERLQVWWDCNHPTVVRRGW